ncbi:MAG: hypothetical protein HYZ93_03880 [Candidatus Omnitrophica bacterium]|nr:hypothetical protein [Candidatus Omnitrophota bacterium]
MGDLSDGRLDRLLKQAFPAVDVSPDFTLRLWHRLMRGAGRPPWMVPAPVAALAAGIGLWLGLWSWSSGTAAADPSVAVLGRMERLDLFGNAPLDSVAGSYLKLTRDQ